MEFAQPPGLLFKYLEGLFSKVLDDVYGQFGTDARDRRGEEFLNAGGGGGQLHVAIFHLKLPSELRMVRPMSCDFDAHAGLHAAEAAGQYRLASAAIAFQPKHCIAIVGIGEDHPQNLARERSLRWQRSGCRRGGPAGKGQLRGR